MDIVSVDECVFCQIAAGNTHSSLVYQDESVIAFLDKSPLKLGHTLLIPKTHVSTVFDLNDELGAQLFRAVRLVGYAVKEGCDAEGLFVAMNNVISQSVPHVHFHLVPRKKGDPMKGFFWPRYRYAAGEEELFRLNIAKKIPRGFHLP